MAKSKYRQGPDGWRIDPDRGSSSVVGLKQAEVARQPEATERDRTRAGARDLDASVEAMPGLTRMQRDRERAMPRSTAADLGHPLKERHLPRPHDVRVPMSSRQRKARSAAKNQTQDRLPKTQYEAVDGAISSPAQWQGLNDALSDAAGDVHADNITDSQRREMQRIDRAIMAAEANNDRGHLVYANVRMPEFINSSNLDAFVTNGLRRGDVVNFDRYTGATHNLHELELDDSIEASRTAVFEIQTRRGMYLGASDSKQYTPHLLPRGPAFTIVGMHRARYRREDGTTGERMVIQLRDHAPDPAPDQP